MKVFFFVSHLRTTTRKGLNSVAYLSYVWRFLIGKVPREHLVKPVLRYVFKTYFLLAFANDKLCYFIHCLLEHCAPTNNGYVSTIYRSLQIFGIILTMKSPQPISIMMKDITPNLENKQQPPLSSPPTLQISQLHNVLQLG